VTLELNLRGQPESQRNLGAQKSCLLWFQQSRSRGLPEGLLDQPLTAGSVRNQDYSPFATGFPIEALAAMLKPSM
jgi:hypothetical protein